MIWDLPHPTHRRFLESLSPVPHLEAVITGRYIGFLQSLKNSQKSLLTLIFSSCSEDQSSLTGQNLSFLLKKYKKFQISELITDKEVIKKSEIFPLPVEEGWKVNMIEEISLVKKEQIDMEFELDDLDDILLYICTC